jgi:ABC-type antimicrobial peptide transport system ATPase subunit
MSHSSVPHAEPEDADRVSRIERMLDLAELVGVVPEHLALIAHRVAACEREREGLGPSARRDELDAVIAEGLETVAVAFVRMRDLVDRMPAA